MPGSPGGSAFVGVIGPPQASTGILYSGSQPLQFRNNVLVGGGGREAIGLDVSGSSVIVSDYNSIFGFGTPYSKVDPGFHDILASPLLVDLDGDFRLGPLSPARDRGNVADLPSGFPNDIFGNPRIVDGNGDGIPVIDIGAIEGGVLGQNSALNWSLYP